MTNIADFLMRVVKTIEDELGDHLKLCKPLAGYIETTDISAIHGKSPALFITTVGSSETSLVETGECDVSLNIVAYLLVVQPDSLKRESQVQDTITRLSMLIPNQQWGMKNCFPAKELEITDFHGLSKGFQPHITSWRTGVSVLAYASDLYGGSDPVSHLALWGFTWEQAIRIGQIEAPPAKLPNELISRISQPDEQLWLKKEAERSSAR
jgi:hypothetical protein